MDGDRARVERGLVDGVAALLRDVAAVAVTPRFRALRGDDVAEKSPGEVVTAADREAEVLLAAGLADLAPGVPVVGEEAASADPALHHDLARHRRVWLVDPLDGTANFVRGSTHHALMVALVEHGRTTASWIWRPATATLHVALRGGGAWRNGAPVRRRPAPAGLAALRGAVYTGFLPPHVAARADMGRLGATDGGTRCAGVDYPAVVAGGLDVALYWRTLPWDHAPGALLVEEAGGVARRPDGSPYSPGTPGHGLLVAADEATWHRVRVALLPGRSGPR